MQAGDCVLFSQVKTGMFTHIGTVALKLQNERLGQALWKVVPGKPWDLIYLLRNVQQVRFAQPLLFNAIGYDRKYVLRGFTKVLPSRLITARRNHASPRLR